MYTVSGWCLGFFFPSVGNGIINFIIPTDDSSIIFQRGKYTTNQFSLSPAEA